MYYIFGGIVTFILGVFFYLFNSNTTAKETQLDEADLDQTVVNLKKDNSGPGGLVFLSSKKLDNKKTDKIKLNKTQLDKIEPNKIELDKIEPNKIELDKKIKLQIEKLRLDHRKLKLGNIKLDKIEPNKIEPNKTQLDTREKTVDKKLDNKKTDQTKLNKKTDQTKLNKIELNKTQLDKIEPNKIELDKIEPNKIELDYRKLKLDNTDMIKQNIQTTEAERESLKCFIKRCKMLEKYIKFIIKEESTLDTKRQYMKQVKKLSLIKILKTVIQNISEKTLQSLKSYGENKNKEVQKLVSIKEEISLIPELERVAKKLNQVVGGIDTELNEIANSLKKGDQGVLSSDKKTENLIKAGKLDLEIIEWYLKWNQILKNKIECINSKFKEELTTEMQIAQVLQVKGIEVSMQSLSEEVRLIKQHIDECNKVMKVQKAFNKELEQVNFKVSEIISELDPVRREIYEEIKELNHIVENLKKDNPELVSTMNIRLMFADMPVLKDFMECVTDNPEYFMIRIMDNLNDDMKKRIEDDSVLKDFKNRITCIKDDNPEVTKDLMAKIKIDYPDVIECMMEQIKIKDDLKMKKNSINKALLPQVVVKIIIKLFTSLSNKIKIENNNITYGDKVFKIQGNHKVPGKLEIENFIKTCGKMMLEQVQCHDDKDDDQYDDKAVVFEQFISKMEEAWMDVPEGFFNV